MTLAICLKCGAEKRGAFTTCTACGYVPQEPEDMAKSLLLSDHNMNHQDLAAVAASIRAGLQPQFNSDQLEEVASTIGQDFNSMKPPVGCLIVWYAPIVIMLLLIAAIIGIIVFIRLNTP